MGYDNHNCIGKVWNKMKKLENIYWKNTLQLVIHYIRKPRYLKSKNLIFTLYTFIMYI